MGYFSKQHAMPSASLHLNYSQAESNLPFFNINSFPPLLLHNYHMNLISCFLLPRESISSIVLPDFQTQLPHAHGSFNVKIPLMEAT